MRSLLSQPVSWKQRPHRLAAFLIALYSAGSAMANTYMFEQRSEPQGLISAQSGIYPVGTPLQTVNAPISSSGYSFAYWTVNGIRASGLFGQSLTRADVSLTTNMTAIAYYLSPSLDNDADGAADSLEWLYYGSLTNGPSLDFDEDGFAHCDEVARGYSPVIRDEPDDGGWMSRLSAPSVYRDEREWKNYDIRSDPQGIVAAQSGFALTGTVITTASVPVGSSSGYYFGYWEVNGVRQADCSGQALSRVSLVMTNDIVAIARFFSSGDSDSDGLEDWLELYWFGELGQSLDSDPDEDGFSISNEMARGYGVRIPDELEDGGFILRLSSLAAYRDENERKHYEIRSDPQGIVVAKEGYAETGTVIFTVSVPVGASSDYYFGYWDVNGKRQADPSGQALSRVALMMTNDVIAIARFFSAGDSDMDGLEDWREWYWFGDVGWNPDSDPDEDGFSIGNELARGYPVQIKDVPEDGGALLRLSAMAVFRDENARKHYEIRSDPQGIVAATAGYGVTGTVVFTPSVPMGASSGYYFGFWDVNGVRQGAPSGLALSRVPLCLTNDIVAIARFFSSGDSDADGLEDWLERYWFGDLSFNSFSDPDGDGFTISNELVRGYSTHLRDEPEDGGMMIRLSAPMKIWISDPMMSLLGTNGAAIDTGEAASLEKGSDFGPVAIGATVTNEFVVTNVWADELSISGLSTSGAGAGRFSVSGLPSSIAPSSAKAFQIVFHPDGDALFAATMSIAYGSTNTPYILHLAGTGIKRDQSIDFPAISDKVATETVGLAAKADSDLAVSFSVADGPATLSGGTNLSFTSAGSISIVASQPGDATWNPAPDVTNTFTVRKAGATVTLASLSHTYDGTTKNATAATDPTGLTVAFTYDGADRAPTAAGHYAVTGTIVEARYQGAAAGTLTIGKARASVTLADLRHTYDGTAKQATATTDPAGLTVGFTYDGSDTAPVAAGRYAITGTIVEANYQGSVSGTLEIAKRSQAIVFPNPGAQVTTGTPTLSAAAASGLPVTFAVVAGPAALSDGTNLSFTGAGSVRVVASQAGNENWLAAPDVTNDFEVALTASSVLQFTPDSPQTYNTKSLLTATGGSGTGAMSFAVLSGPGEIIGTNLLKAVSGTGQIVLEAVKASDGIYQTGRAIATTTVAKATQTITFRNPNAQFWTNHLGLVATASSGLAVMFGVKGPAGLTGDTNLSFTGYGEVTVVAVQDGDENWAAAGPMTNRFQVVGPEPAAVGADGALMANGAVPSLAAGSDFGCALVGLERITNTFALTNMGTGRLTLSSVVTNGPNAGSFRLVEAPKAVPAGGSAPIRVAFAPAAGGPRMAAFAFAHDGTGAVYILNVAGQGLDGGIVLASNALAFSGIYGSNSQLAASVMLTNVGVSGFAYDCAVTYGPSAENWLTVTPAAGVVSPSGAVELASLIDTTGLNAGVHTATGTITAADATNSPVCFVVTLDIGKAAQLITFTNPGLQKLSAETAISATAGSNGIPVTFTVISGPAELSATTSPAVVTYSAGGLVTIEARLAGDGNWLPADPVRQTWRAGYTLTVTSPLGTVTNDPDTPYYDHGTVVTLAVTPDASYLFRDWSGDLTGSDNPITLIMDGDRSVTAHFAPMAPAVLPPAGIGKKSFRARWMWVQGGAPEGELSVSTNAAFTALVPGFESRYVVNVTETVVVGLISNREYWYRVHRLMPDGSFSPWSAKMKVRTGQGMPIFRNLLSDGPVSKGVSQQFALTNLVAGTGKLTVKSSNPSAVKAAAASGVLTLQYLWKGTNTANVTMTVKHPVTGYTAVYYTALKRAWGHISVVETNELTSIGTHVAQEITLENLTGGTVYGVRIGSLGLDKPAWLINGTGMDPASKTAIREIPCVLPAGSQMVVRLVYNADYLKQAKKNPVAYEAWAIMAPVHSAMPVTGEMTITRQDLYDGRWLLGLPANRNRLYTIYRSDDGGVSWSLAVPVIRAAANYLMWMDADDGAPEGRLYRVIDSGI